MSKVKVTSGQKMQQGDRVSGVNCALYIECPAIVWNHFYPKAAAGAFRLEIVRGKNWNDWGRYV